MRKTNRFAKLHLEILEDRTAPAGGVLSGTAFLDANANGVFDAGEPVLSGVTVTLTGGSNRQGSPVNVTTTTNANGLFSFNELMPGTYQVSAGPVAGLLNGAASASGIAAPFGVNTSAPLAVPFGQPVTHNLGFLGGLDPHFISMRDFLTSTTSVPFGTGTPGSGSTTVTPNSAPFVSSAITNVSVPVSSGATQIDLAGHFSDADFTDSQVTMNTSAGPLSITLFDTQAPQTVANYFDYINSGAYNNSIFTRLASLSSNSNTAAPQILQAGGASLVTTGAGSSLVPIAADPSIPNEFDASNTPGTIAMGQSAGDPNSANNQYYFNITDNSSSLDPQNFTVFGKVANAASQAVLNALAATPRQDHSTTSVTGVDLHNVPLNNYTGSNFPTDAAPSNFLVISGFTVDRRDEFLTYSVVSNSNPGLVNASLKNEHLTLTYTAGQVGSATVTVQATDRFGATAQTTFSVTVTPKAPTVTGVTIAPDNLSNTTSLTATPAATDPQNQTVTFTYQWLKNGTAIAGATAATLNLTPLTVAVNDAFTVQVTPSDGLATGGVFTSKAATIATVSPTTLKLPAVTGVTITPNNTANVTSLTAIAQASDPLGQTPTFTFQWLQNGNPIAGATSATLDLTPLTVKVNDTFAVQVTPKDDTLTGAAFTSKSVTVSTVNPTTIALPAVTNVTITPDSTTSTTSLTATPAATDPLGQTVSFAYQWLQNGNPIAGATSATLNLAPLAIHVGDTFIVRVTPSDGTLTGNAFLSKAITIATVSPTTINLPAVTNVDVTADDPNNATILTATPTGTDPYGENLVYAYQWLQNSNPIAGATTATLDLTPLTLAVNDTFSVEVTPSDSVLTGVLFTSGTVTVTGTNPTTIA